MKKTVTNILVVTITALTAGCLYVKAPNPDAVDGFGGHVALSGSALITGASGEDSASRFVNGEESDNSAINAGAAYMYRFSSGSLALEAYLKPFNAGRDQRFGHAVDVRGNTLIVGAYGEKSAGGSGSQPFNTSLTSAGAAYIFERVQSTWQQTGYLKATFPDTHDRFGLSVAMAGTQRTAVIGAPGASSPSRYVNVGEELDTLTWAGAAYVFEKMGGSWLQTAYLKPVNPDAHDHFGQSVAVSVDGTRIVVGAYREKSANSNPYNNSAVPYGAAYVFDYIDGVWQQTKYLKPLSPIQYENFGYEVAISDDGRTIAVGAPRVDGIGEGPVPRVYIFRLDSAGNWFQAQTLIPPSAQYFDRFGTDIGFSPDGARLIVGAPTESGSGIGVDPEDDNNAKQYGTGAAYIYQYDGRRYNFAHYLKGFTTDPDFFGTGVAISGTHAAIGLPGESSKETGVHDVDNGSPDIGDNSKQGAGALMVLDLQSDF